MNVPDRTQGDRRTSNGSVWTEKRQSDRRVSPAVGSFAILQNMQLRAKLAAMVGWLEANEPSVFKRGLWEAIAKAEKEQP